MPDPTPARTVGENGVALYITLNSHVQYAHKREPTHVAFPKDEAAELLSLAAWARELADVLGIGLDRPPEAVFDYFRRLHGIEAPDAI